jgi:hypothetical protein
MMLLRSSDSLGNVADAAELVEDETKIMQG